LFGRPHGSLGQKGEPDAFVFATRTGAKPSRENVRNRVLAPAVKRASERLVNAGYGPLPDHITPHSLRRTFASVLYALGEAPPVVMAEMGHTHAGLALAVYARAMRRDDGEQGRLRSLVEGGEVAFVADGGIRALEASESAVERAAAARTESEH
jgi:integrase